MTRHDANALLDETFGGEDGASPIRFGSWNGREPHYRRHPSEKLVMDRRGRRYRQAEPFRDIPSPDGPSLAELGLGVAVLLVWFFAIFWAFPILAEAVMR